MTLVSVFADASWCPDTRAGGWGGWAKSDRGRYLAGGVFGDKIPSSTDAEICAAVNAIWTAFKKGIAISGDVILIQSDCTGVMHFLDGMRAYSDFQRRAIERLKEWRNQGTVIRSRHVKGHTRGTTPRTWVNIQCDRLARRYMERARLLEKR